MTIAPFGCWLNWNEVGLGRINLSFDEMTLCRLDLFAAGRENLPW